MTIPYKTNALWVCTHRFHGRSGVTSDGHEGPDDGSGHFHPENGFHIDVHSRGITGLGLH